MKKLYSQLLIFCFLFVLFACANSPFSQSNKKQPDWIRDPYKKYDRQANVAAVGTGADSQTAEKRAFGNLITFFGQSIHVDEIVSVMYQEAVQSGAAARWSETTTINSNIITSASMDNLVGAEIGEVWFDGSRTYYAIAFMNKRNAIQIYSQMISANQVIINNLINMPSELKLSLDGISRYNFAATIADINVSYANLLSLLGASSYLHGLKRGDEYRLEAQNIIRSIPISIRVRNDKSNRIQSAFAKALSEQGFRSGGTNSRYVLDVNITVSPVNLPNNPSRFSRMELNTNLIDTKDMTVLLPYNFSVREGHNIQEEAENRTFLTAERIINDEYKDILSEYLLNKSSRF